MVRLSDIPEPKRSHLRKLECPEFRFTPWVIPPPLDRTRVAIVSTAGLHTASDRPFHPGAADFRVIPVDVGKGDLVMSHVSPNYDRTGFEADRNVCFPLDRLRELESEGVIGSVARNHYSFMGATDPRAMVSFTEELMRMMREDEVTAALLVPV
ncbi:MAG: selenoprotein B glycine/betaine/sarcosine/D-proline reductase [bacterium]|nr:MAG: selenoprotein B glycine/betaine/sarcosine/D-proline reductase [bacterium]